MKEELIKAQNEMRTAKKELVKFRKSNKLKAEEVPEDEKLAKTLKKLKQVVETKEAEVAKIKAEIKASKPTRKGFATKYTYPTIVDEETGEEREMDAKEKKAFRTKARAEAKKAAKGEKETPEKAEAAPKKKKKVVKPKAAPAEEEDDD